MSPLSGRGVIVQMRARATLNDVLFFANAGHSLLAEGVGTEVFADKISVVQSRVNPEAVAQGPDRGHKDTAAVEIRNGAALYAENLSIDGPQFFGLRLHNRAKAHIQNGHFQKARMVEGGELNTGGVNISVASSSILELGHLISEHAELCGVIIFGGFITVTGGGSIRNNLIGLAIPAALPEGYTLNDVTRCMRNVEYIQNELNFNSAIMPLPVPMGSLEETTQSSQDPLAGCPRVAWP